MTTLSLNEEQNSDEESDKSDSECYMEQCIVSLHFLIKFELNQTVYMCLFYNTHIFLS